MVSNRFSADNHLPLEQRLLCWAPVIRDLTAIAERTEAGAEIGGELLHLQQELFEHWHHHKQGAIDWPPLRRWSQPSRLAFEHVLQHLAEIDIQEGERTPWAKTVRTCRQLLKQKEALWTFLESQGIKPTNNAAESIASGGDPAQDQPWHAVRQRGHLPKPAADGHHHSSATPTRELALPGEGMDCPSPRRSDAVARASSLILSIHVAFKSTECMVWSRQEWCGFASRPGNNECPVVLILSAPDTLPAFGA